MSHSQKEGAVRVLNLGLKWNGNRIRSFYCRMQNRVLEEGCPQASGPRECPLRRNCQANSDLARETSTPIEAIHSP